MTRNKVRPAFDRTNRKEYLRVLFEYIDAMMSYPLMFSYTCEAYVAQLAILLDLAGLNGNEMLTLFKSENSVSVDIEKMKMAMSTEFAEQVRNKLTEFINKSNVQDRN